MWSAMKTNISKKHFRDASSELTWADPTNWTKAPRTLASGMDLRKSHIYSCNIPLDYDMKLRDSTSIMAA